MFAILTLYPQPTHLEYLPHPRGLAQAQHHPSIHPSTLFSTSPPQPPHPHPHSQHPKPHSLTSMLHNSPPQTSPHQIRNSSSIRQIKKIKNTRDERVASPPQLDPVFFFFWRIRRRARFSPFCRSFKPIDIFFLGRAVSFFVFFLGSATWLLQYHQCLTLAPFSFFFFRSVRFGSMLRFGRGANGARKASSDCVVEGCMHLRCWIGAAWRRFVVVRVGGGVRCCWGGGERGWKMWVRAEGGGRGGGRFGC